MKSFLRNLFMFCFGGLLYFFIEVIYKSSVGHCDRIHFSMAILGGIVFLIIGLLNKWFTFEMPLYQQMLISTVSCVALEFLFGLILNVYFKLNVWDYSNLKGNVLGQICPQFALIWFAVSFPAILLDDFLRMKLFKEQKPHYHIFKRSKECNKFITL